MCVSRVKSPARLHDATGILKGGHAVAHGDVLETSVAHRKLKLLLRGKKNKRRGD